MYTIQIKNNKDLWHEMEMSDNEERKKYVQRYRRRDLSNGGKQEPGDTLMNRRHISIMAVLTPSENRRQHLFQKQASKTKIGFVKAPTEQAKEHYEKQDCVGSEIRENIVYAAICVEHRTGVLRRHP